MLSLVATVCTVCSKLHDNQSIQLAGNTRQPRTNNTHQHQRHPAIYRKHSTNDTRQPTNNDFRWQIQPQSTYICRVQSCVWRLPKYWPPTPLSTPQVCPTPAHSPGGEGGGGSIFWKTPAIGLASYNNLSSDSTDNLNINTRQPTPNNRHTR
jgi:hypothetical protein